MVHLEMETMKQKYEGWKDEVQRLLPLESEVEKMRILNGELSQQLTLVLEEGERKQAVVEGEASGKKKNVIDYDSLVEKLTLLQDTRVTMEEELGRLREERASILKENATLSEGSQPQLYASLKVRYKDTSARLLSVSNSYKEEKKVREQLEAANVELHQKLVEATDQNMLRPIQERLDRYKKERDLARADCEELNSKLANVSADLLSAREYADVLEKEMVRLKAESSKLETRLRSYRDERNVARERLKELEHQTREHHHQKHQQQQQQHRSSSSNQDPTTIPAWHDDDLEHSLSPTLEYQYGISVLPYTSEQYPTSSESQPHHKDAESPTPSDDSMSPSPLTATSLQAKNKSSENYAQPPSKPKCESPSTLGLHNRTVEVRTKEGTVMMDIQRPLAKLNPKYKPQVVVRRSDGYQAGTLMYLGRVNDQDIAGVYMDTRLQSECVAKVVCNMALIPMAYCRGFNFTLMALYIIIINFI